MTRLKIGTVDCAIAATLESMCCSPQAISQYGNGRVEQTKNEHRPPGVTQLGERDAEPRRDDEVAEQNSRRDQQPRRHQRRRVDVLHGHLDEQVRRPPGRREDQQQGPEALAFHPR